MSSSSYSINLMSSSIDVSTIVENLMYVERAPVRIMESKVSTLEGKVGAYQSLNTKLSALADKLNTLLFGSSDAPLTQPYSFADRLSKSIFAQSEMISSDEDAISATASGVAAGGSYAITVSSLAQAHTMISSSFADATSTSIGTGTVTITGGSGEPVTLTLNDTNSTLNGLRDAINNAQAGVTATIINDGSSTPYRLMLTSNDTGTANAFTVTSSLSGGQSPTFSQTQAATDAQFTVNGVSIIKSSNTISDVIDGVTLTLKNQTAAPVTLRAQRDTDAIVTALNEFVTAYNAVNSFINSQFTYNADAEGAGILAGDSTLRRVQSLLQNPLSQSVKNPYTNLAVASQAGLEFSRDGSLSLNESEFREAIGNNFTAVAALFLGDGTPAGGATASDRRVNFAGKTPLTQAGTYAIQVDALAQRASATGNQVVSLLSGDETLTITSGTSTAIVSLLQDDSLTTVLSKINESLMAHGIAATARDDGAGRIHLYTNNYGSSQTLTIVSDREDLSGTTGFGSAPVTVAGTDIAGSINGHVATGKWPHPHRSRRTARRWIERKHLPDGDGQLRLRHGCLGTEGVAGTSILMRLFTALDGLTDSLSGPIVNATDGLKKNIESLNDQISEYEMRLEKRRETLTAEYDAADQALRLMTVLQSSLASQISSLSSKK